MTKKEFCLCIIKDYIEKEGLNVDPTLLQEHHAIKSSKVAVAMEYLGLLHEPYKSYAKDRDGLLFVYCNPEKREFSTLSVRDILNLLPGE